MKIISGIVPGALSGKRLQELSKKARQRLKWFDYCNCRGYNARLTCRYFGISPQIFYRWKRRNSPRHITSLEDRSHQPRQLRKPTYSTELVEAVLKLRDEYSHWDKEKLAVLLVELPCYALSDALSWPGFESCLTKEFSSTTELSLNL